MPPPDPIAEDAADRLASLRLVRLVTDRQRIVLGQSATLRWEVKSEGERGLAGISFKLDRIGATARGSRQVSPVRTTVYRLTAHTLAASRVLGEVTVEVDASNSIQVSHGEYEIRELIGAFIAGEIDAYNEAPMLGLELKQTSTSVLAEIDNAGIMPRLRYEIEVPNFFNPKLKIDATIALGFADGKTIASYRKFAVDIDWPWYAALTTLVTLGGITLTLGELTTRISERLVDGVLKPKLLEGIRGGIDTIVKLDSRYTVIALFARRDEIIVTKFPR